MDDDEFRMDIEMQISDGSLNGLDPQTVFVYGVEFGIAVFLTQVQIETYTMAVHADNAKRIVDMLEHFGFDVEQQWINDDWMELRITPNIAERVDEEDE